jgi:hypothetical protein
VEKRGLQQALKAAGIPVAPGVAFADEMRLGLRGMVRRVWAPRGIKIVQAVELRYEWRYLVLAVDGLRGILRWQWAANMKGATLAPILADWHADGLVGVVWDGAGSHRGKPVRAVGLPTVMQPAASPELNPAERVFEAVRDVVEGRSYATLADKQAVADGFLHKLAAAPERIRSLAGWAWIATALTPAPEIPQS